MKGIHVVLVLLLLIGSAHFVLAGEIYRFPGYPVMINVRVASNGSSAFVLLSVEEYGKMPNYMCPIDSPDTYIGCRELSSRRYLLFEVGDGVRYINITPLSSFNFTDLSMAPLGERWYLVGASYLSHCALSFCPNVTYRVMEYFPATGRIGLPVETPEETSDVLFHLADVMAIGGVSSNGSITFSFPYDGNYSVPIAAFEGYLSRLNFSDSSVIGMREFLSLLRAVPFRGGLIIYLPGYGLESYTGEPYREREYLLIENRLDPYAPYGWVAHAGFSCFPSNESGNLTGSLFPPVFYYRNGMLTPLLNISVETFNYSPKGSAERFICSRPVLELPGGRKAKIGGASTKPDLRITEENRVYSKFIRVIPHYSPENSTLVDLCVNRKELLHVRVSESGLAFLRMPFPGLFSNSNGSWFYNRLSERGLEDLCIHDWGPIFNGTFVYNPENETLAPSNLDLQGNNRERHMGVRVEGLENLSECAPLGAELMLHRVRVGRGVLFYYPFYVTGISLTGRGVVTVWGDYSTHKEARLNETCPFFYMVHGRIVSALRLNTEELSVPAGDWDVGVSIPYINVSNTVNVSLSNSSTTSTTTGGASRICGPALIVVLSVFAVSLCKRR